MAIPIKKMTTTHISTILLDSCIMPYGIPDRILTDNGPHLARNEFNAACVAFRTELMTTALCHPCTNSLKEHYNRTIINRLHHYVSENQSDWSAVWAALL